MQDLMSKDFHRTVEATPAIAVVFTNDPEAEADQLLDPTVVASADDWRWFRVDTAEAPDLASMFGLGADLPALLLMRERVVLFAGGLAGLPAERLQALLSGAGRLDMGLVHAQIARQREGEAVIAARRVCPTAFRAR
jgi:hypothetical protein